jgi:hypothetical protein
MHIRLNGLTALGRGTQARSRARLRGWHKESGENGEGLRPNSLLAVLPALFVNWICCWRQEWLERNT